MKNVFRNTRATDVFMCAAFPLMAVIAASKPELRDLAPWCALASILPVGGYLAGYRWV